MAHTHDTLCLTIAVFLVRDGKVLLANHPRYSAWLSIGGHIDPGEDTDETLYKEIWEEAALPREAVRILSEKEDIPGDYRRSLYTPAYVDRHRANDREHVAFVYFGEVLNGYEPQMSEEHVELRWFSADDLDAMKDKLLPDIIWYAKEALKRSLE